ncbi:hypothetical protein NQZ68_016404 [Dissostichus eleginoides]|nr:hypothetical protein NQZ68_016404 [Dissostichus eleginoides]
MQWTALQNSLRIQFGLVEWGQESQHHRLLALMEIKVPLMEQQQGMVLCQRAGTEHGRAIKFPSGFPTETLANRGGTFPTGDPSRKKASMQVDSYKKELLGYFSECGEAPETLPGVPLVELGSAVVDEAERGSHPDLSTMNEALDGLERAVCRA